MAHSCASPGCEVVLGRDDQPMCGVHWLMVPPSLRRDIEAVCVSLGTGSTQYARVVLEAVRVVTEKLRAAG